MPDDDRRSVGVRVRPNSHDFIRQLRQDLAGKRYTYNVKVGADTNQATRDIRAWAAGPLQKIHASVPVRANTGPATRDMAEWRRRQAGISTTVKVHADTSAAVREISALEAMARDITVKVKADTARARESAARAGTRSAGRSSAAADIDKEFQVALKKGVDAAHARLDEIRSAAKKPVEIKLELDPTADYKLRTRLKAIEAKLKADPIKTALEIEIGDAERQLLALKIQEKAKKLSLPARFDPTDIKQMRGELALLRLREEANDIKLRVNVSRSSLEQAKAAMDRVSKQFGKFNLIRSLDVGPFNLGKPSGLVGTVSTLTLLAGALPGVVAGTTALSDGLIRLAGAAGLVPGAIGAIAASLATLSIGTKGIGDAFTTLFAMWDEGASQQGKASTKLVAAQNNYTDAVVDEQRAQERVGDARRQALSDLRSLNNELRGGVLNEAQALLDLQKAKDRYAQGDFENNTERLQGQLDIQRAELNLATTREDNINLQQKANDANTKGVEGSDAVRDALDGQRRAAESVTQALEALNAGGAGATTATQKFQDQLAQLSPNAQDFVMSVAAMKGPMLDFRNLLQDTIFQGAGPAFTDMFKDLLPTIQPGMQQIAQGLNQNMLQVFDTLKSPDGKSIIERILGGTAETQKALTGLIDPLIKGVGTLVAAGTEHMPQVVELFTRLAERFSIFIDKADKSGALDKFLDKGIGALADMAEIGINLVQIVNDLSEAFGGNILTDIKHLTDQWHEFLSSDEGQAKLKGFLQEAKDLWAEWKPVIMEIPGAFAAVSEAAKNVLGFLLPTLENILGFLDKFPGALEAIATAIIVSRLLGSFSTLAKTVGLVFTALKGMPDLISRIPAMPQLPGTTPGATAAGGGVGGTLAAAAGAVAAPLAIGGYAASVAGDAGVGGLGQLAAGSAAASLAYTPGVAVLPLLLHDKDFALKTFGTADENARKKLLDAVWKKFEENGHKDEDAKKLYGGSANGQMPRDQLEAIAMAAAGAPSYMSGGYTDWGAKSGRPIIAHGGEYIEPKPTVDHYGVDAMKAVHDKRAVISYDAGGSVPMAYPGNPKIPGVPWPRRVSIGIGGGLGSYTPSGVGPIPGSTGEGRLGGWQSPFWGKMPKGDPNAPHIPPWMDKRRGVEGFEDGGLVFDPVTGQFVQTGAAVSHGQNPAAAGPGIIDSLATNVTSGLSNVAATVTPTTGGGNTAVSPFGVTGNLPGPDPSAQDSRSPFADSFLSGLGIPGLGGDNKDTSSGPGWGDGGPPIGLGGGSDGFDIRKYKIGPGPMGSGPGDWMKFTGETLGNFASSFITTLGSGLLGALGISGLASYITDASPALQHFFGEDKKGSYSSGEYNGAVANLLDTSANMPGNPPYPGIPALPGVFDPASGSALNPNGAGNGGLQINTLRGKAAIQAAFPWATNIGGVRADNLKWHPQGLALDVMTDPGHGNNDPSSPEGLAKGNALVAWIKANQQALGVDYFMWQEKDHYNHVHVNFAASGYPAGGGPANVGTPAGLVPPGSTGWGMGSATPDGKTLPQQAPKQAPGAGPLFGPNPLTTMSLPPKGDPKKLFGGSFDRGGWLMPGTTIVQNNTGRPEWGGPLPSFAYGGLNTGLVPYRPLPRPPDAITKTAPPPPPVVVPKPAVPAITPPAPPVATPPHIGTGAPPGPETPPAPQGPSGSPINLGPVRPATGAGPGAESGIHTHPALAKGITSGFATAGNIAGAAASMGMGGAGGALGGFVSGLFGQAGKIANNIANVASSFLVGNITGGTTENPYGVTQRGNVPSGGSRVVDASNNQYGDVYTNNLDEYFKRKDRQEAQHAQSDLGRWGTQV